MSLNLIADKRKVDTPDKLLSRKFDAAACIKEREDHLRRKTHDLRKRFANCNAVDGGILYIYCEL
jgi:hypothetical protein